MQSLEISIFLDFFTNVMAWTPSLSIWNFKKFFFFEIEKVWDIMIVMQSWMGLWLWFEVTSLYHRPKSLQSFLKIQFLIQWFLLFILFSGSMGWSKWAYNLSWLNTNNQNQICGRCVCYCQQCIWSITVSLFIWNWIEILIGNLKL